MISCTEFIPLYSEFFKFLDSIGGHDAVLEFWYNLSDNGIGDKTNPHSLASFIERSEEGAFAGACNYWKHTLKEEACDVIKIYDYKKKCCHTHMRYCPSRGMLNALKHVEPYYDYCGHCNVIYQRVLEKYGLKFEMDHSKIDNAECYSLLYEEGHKPTGDCSIIDDTKEVLDMKAEDNKYLHRDFHLIGDMALKYCGETFGDSVVIDFLTSYTKNYYAPQIEQIQSCGLSALKEWIENLYTIEEASEVLHTKLDEDGLTVIIDKSPVIEYMHSLNQEPSKYYIEETRTLYKVVAEACGFVFSLDYYNEDGGTKFHFHLAT
ncbi:MAG: hypothetical protein II997_05475 [Clostridia bacterium]|nr:hypothetical protein [Clostridia bacterium]